VNHKPSDYPPPFQADEFINVPTDPPDERIEVGVLVVGAGPAGLACAIRFGQLLESDPEVAEQLGDVPLAIIDKGKQPGSHLLSGAVVNPRSLKALFGGSFRIDNIPNYGPVTRESVYVLTKNKALPIPAPPPMRNHGNVIVSLSELGRWLTSRAEEAGAMILPETPGHSLLIDEGRVSGVRTGDKGRAADGSELRNFEPGADIVAKLTVLAEGTQGHLTGVALDHFGLRPKDPQVYELGVKEVWRVDSPLDRIIHTLGWPLRTAAKYREFGGSFIYPNGPDMLTIGMVVGLDYRDADLSVHDLLQELKTHPKIRPMLASGERLEWGAKTIPSGGFHALPKRFHAPGVLFCGDGAGMVNIPTLKGIHYAIESGRLAAESAFQAIKRSNRDELPGAGELESYDRAVQSSFIWSDLHEVRDVRHAFGRGFFVGGALATTMIVSKGRVHVGRMDTERDDDQVLIESDRAATYPVADGHLVFDKLSSVFASGNETRDDQPDHIRIQKRVPADVARLWAHTCPAQVYEVEAEGDGEATVRVTPSNCVQCGAISAKGGRLTPSEGGSGPQYSRS
jgi:electron-transferring-flavoprotein dehydrogenase